MKVFPSYATNPEKRQFSFVLQSQPFHQERSVTLIVPILSSDIGIAFAPFLSAWYGRSALGRKKSGRVKYYPYNNVVE